MRAMLAQPVVVPGFYFIDAEEGRWNSGREENNLGYRRLGAGEPTSVSEGRGVRVVSLGMVAAGVSVFTPYAYNYLLGVALFGAMTVWIFILVSHLSFRRRHKAPQLPVRMPWFPWMQLAALGLLIAILVTMGLDEEFWRTSWIVGVPWLVLLSIAYFVWRPRRERLSSNRLDLAGNPAKD